MPASQFVDLRQTPACNSNLRKAHNLQRRPSRICRCDAQVLPVTCLWTRPPTTRTGSSPQTMAPVFSTISHLYPTYGKAYSGHARNPLGDHSHCPPVVGVDTPFHSLDNLATTPECTITALHPHRHHHQPPQPSPPIYSTRAHFTHFILEIPRRKISCFFGIDITTYTGGDDEFEFLLRDVVQIRF